MHEVPISLTDEHGNKSQYILMLEVLSEAATDLNPLLNSPPYFKEKEWEDSIPVELA